MSTLKIRSNSMPPINMLTNGQPKVIVQITHANCHNFCAIRTVYKQTNYRNCSKNMSTVNTLMNVPMYKRYEFCASFCGSFFCI